MAGGYDAIYGTLIPRLAGCDFAESAAQLGLELTEEGNIKARFLGRNYLITKDGAEPMDGKPVDINNLSVLLYYVLSKGSGQPRNSFTPLFRLTGVLEGRWGQYSDMMMRPLIREFGGNYPRFCRAAAAVGGKCQNESEGRHEWLFRMLPKIPAKVVFYEADEEFPAEIQVFLDETAPMFLDFECLAFLVGCFVKTLIRIAKDGF